MGGCAHRGGRVCLCTYVNCIFCRKCLRFVEEKEVRKRVCLFCANCFRCWKGRGRYPSLGDEGGLGEEAAFFFLGLAINGDLDGHLGCVLKNDVSEK